MNRRSFLSKPLIQDILSTSSNTITSNKFKNQPDVPLGSGSDLSPYQPRPDKPWNARRAAHLLRRANFGCNWNDIIDAVKTSPKNLISKMLSPGPLPLPPVDNNATGTYKKDWTNQQPFAYVDNVERSYYYARLRDTMEWWYDLMMKPAQGLREKNGMVLAQSFYKRFYNGSSCSIHFYSKSVI